MSDDETTLMYTHGDARNVPTAVTASAAAPTPLGQVERVVTAGAGDQSGAASTPLFRSAGSDWLVPPVQQGRTQPDLAALISSITAGLTSGLHSSLGDTVKEAVGGRKRKNSEDDIEEKQEDLVLVDIPNHHIHDDGAKIGDWVARSLKPWTGEQEELWKNKRRVARPILQKLKDGHLSRGYVNPRLLARLHDRGAELSLKQFFHKNANVTERKGRLRIDNESSSAAYTFDYVEPQTVWECVDAVHHYTTALRSIRAEDYSGAVLLRVLHDVRFFAGANKTDKSQAAMLTKFVNMVFIQNSLMGRSSEPPLPYKEVLEIAKQVMFEAGHDGMLSVVGVEPYTGSRRNQEAGSAASGAAAKSGGSGGSTWSGQQPGARGTVDSKPFSAMSTAEKVARCCKDFNLKGCTDRNCRKPHICSRVLPGGQVCWKGGHNEPNHK